jgi:hypothetical protein
LPGNGDGTFGPPISSRQVDLEYGTPITVADFNGDGKPDLAVGGYILLGNGDGTFQNLLFLGQYGQVAAADFNGDGKVDLAQGSGTDIAIFLGNGDGTFGLPVSFAAGNNPWFTAVGDFSGSGKPDLAVANQTSNNVSVLTNGSR